ncbi:hypothetical protein Pelo_14677 [Pelomyxa schiedti]|nr:hypothetical protein Pelo_14677 [Pelomyxa schiedti]
MPKVKPGPRAVVVGNIGLKITEEMLRGAMQQFGPLLEKRPIKMKPHRAYVVFEEQESAQRAIASSPIHLGDKKCTIALPPEDPPQPKKCQQKQMLQEQPEQITSSTTSLSSPVAAVTLTKSKPPKQKKPPKAESTPQRFVVNLNPPPPGLPVTPPSSVLSSPLDTSIYLPFSNRITQATVSALNLETSAASSSGCSTETLQSLPRYHQVELAHPPQVQVPVSFPLSAVTKPAHPPRIQSAPLVLWCDYSDVSLVNNLFGHSIEANLGHLLAVQSALFSSISTVTSQPTTSVNCKIFMQHISEATQQTFKYAEQWLQVSRCKRQLGCVRRVSAEVFRLLRSFYEDNIVPSALVLINYKEDPCLLEWASSISLPCLCERKSPTSTKVPKYPNVTYLDLCILLGQEPQYIADLLVKRKIGKKEKKPKKGRKAKKNKQAKAVLNTEGNLWIPAPTLEQNNTSQSEQPESTEHPTELVHTVQNSPQTQNGSNSTVVLQESSSESDSDSDTSEEYNTTVPSVNGSE